MLMEDAEGGGVAEESSDIGRVLAAGRHLLGLINDVLDLSKIEAGRMDIEVMTFDANDVVHAAIETAEPLAAARGNVIRLFLPPVPLTVTSDRTKLQQILLNLVGNACKFTRDGHISVSARLEPGTDGDWLVLAVQDSGIGMTAEESAKLFKDFTQADASTTRRYGGTGLGLAISQRLCGLLGGAIAVASEAGSGSTFTIRVPATLTGHAGVRPSSKSTPAPTTAWSGKPENRTVLVVDDDAGARDLAVRALNRAGIRTIQALRAEEALDLIRHDRPDALVLDVILPGRNGWSLLEELKATPSLADIPVVVVSVHDNRHESLSRGAIEHLTKPIRGEQLAATIAASFHAPGNQESVAAGAAAQERVQ